MNPVIPEGVDPAEALAATIGAEAFLGGKIKLTNDVRDRAASMDHTIDRMVFEAFSGEPEAVPEIALNFKDVSKALDSLADPDQTRERNKGFQTAFAGEPHETTAAVQEVAGRVLRHLDDHLPRRQRTGIVATPTAPSGVELARFKRLWAIACNPLHVCEALGRGNLSRDMVRAVEDLYPSVYKAMRMAVIKAIGRTKARRASWQPSRALDLQLRVLMQADTITPQLAAEIDAAGLAPAKPEAPHGKAVDSGDMQTSGQRIAGR